MVAIIVLNAVVWLSIPLVLSRAMARRGFDGLSYLIVGTRWRRHIHGLHSRLADVGDAWRALLLGAPPVLL